MPGAVDAEELAERMENLDVGFSGSEATLGSGTGSPAVGSKVSELFKNNFDLTVH